MCSAVNRLYGITYLLRSTSKAIRGVYGLFCSVSVDSCRRVIGGPPSKVTSAGVTSSIVLSWKIVRAWLTLLLLGRLIVVLQAGHSPSQEALQAFGRERLARYKVPKRFVFTDALPYSPYGKVMKVELKKKYVA